MGRAAPKPGAVDVADTTAGTVFRRAGGGAGRGRRDWRLSNHEDLGSLGKEVAERAERWGAKGDVNSLRRAFELAVELGMQPGDPPAYEGPEQELRKTVMDDLGRAYCELLARSSAPSSSEAAYCDAVREARDCILPLAACGKARYWPGYLADDLVQRLAANDGALLQTAESGDHADLWGALWGATEIVEDWEPPASPDTLASVLGASARCLLLLKPGQLSARDCSMLLPAAAELCFRVGEVAASCKGLLHHLTSCLADMASRADCVALAGALYTLGNLAALDQHTPQPEDLQRLEAEVARRLIRAQRADDAAAAAAAAEAEEVEEGDDGGAEPAASGALSSSDVATDQEETQRHQFTVGGFTHTQLSAMLWACAKLRRSDSPLLRPLAAAAGRAAWAGSACSIMVSLHTLAELGCSGAKFAPALRALADAAVQMLRSQQSDVTAPYLFGMLAAAARLQQPQELEELVTEALAEIWRRGPAAFIPADGPRERTAAGGLRPVLRVRCTFLLHEADR
ncbi:hypothetical protein GPECTOR_31g300 [Gonium pectorale]|uniref:Uncharacterized protein n=1 Tax=Gonium pectorale TaxID=33097 RepID=A0A150GDP9_GONPE|nr:hypothetical protein GPECTOR_31g300 [Gonium pectorale]|eukprot:KXZ47938.1 hypothetical protein GPECTOR_31g300 [Gonium pectorale]